MQSFKERNKLLDLFRLVYYSFCSSSILLALLILFSLIINSSQPFILYIYIYFSLLIHELGHYLAIIILDKESIQDIIISWNFNGVSFEFESTRNINKIIIGFAGVLFNLVTICVLFYFISNSNLFLITNVVVCIFSILPGSNDLSLIIKGLAGFKMEKKTKSLENIKSNLYTKSSKNHGKN